MFACLETRASLAGMRDVKIALINQAILNNRSNSDNPRLRRVLWNPWQSNGKLRNMKNRSFKVLCHKQIRNARRGSKQEPAMKSLQAEGRFLHGCEISLLLRKSCPFAAKFSQPFCTARLFS
ncbi:hypothetical protein AAG906_026314 [Vitis piasezkii]